MDDSVTEFRKRLKAAADHLADWEKDAHEDYDFVAGDQWSTEDKAYLEEQLRPVITFNRVGPLVDTVCGSEVSNRQEVRYIPRGLEDTGVTEFVTAAAKWVRDQCEAEDEESDAFRDCVISGYGWTETRIDYEEDPDGKIFIERVDPFEMKYDPSAKKSNLVDSNWFCRSTWVDKDIAQEMWPDAVFSAESELQGYTDDHNASDAWKYKNSVVEKNRENEVLIHKYQFCKKVPFYRALDPMSGKVVELSEEKYNLIKDQGIKAVKQMKKVWFQQFISGETLLEETELDGPTLNAITGKRDQNSNTFYGIVRAMKDPQRWANKFFSQILYIINSNAKGGVMAEAGAFQNPRKAEEEWAKPASITILKDGALAAGKIQPKPVSPYPSGLDQLMMFAISSIRDVAGINLEQLGMSNRQQSGVLEDMRKQAGLTILAGMFDSLRKYRKIQGKTLVEFLKFVADGRLIRITNQGQAKYVPMVRMPDTLKYDIIVDQSPTSPNYKEKIFGVMAQLIPQFVSAGFPVPPSILDYTPLPEAVVMEWKQMMQNPQKQQEQQEQMMIQKEQAKADIHETHSKAQLNEAKIQEIMNQAQSEIAKIRSEEAKSQAAIMKSGLDIQKAQIGLQNDRMKLPIDTMNAQTDRMYAESDMMRAMMEPFLRNPQ